MSLESGFVITILKHNQILCYEITAVSFIFHQPLQWITFFTHFFFLFNCYFLDSILNFSHNPLSSIVCLVSINVKHFIKSHCQSVNSYIQSGLYGLYNPFSLLCLQHSILLISFIANSSSFVFLLSR